MTTDEGLMAAYQQGDVAAFATLVTRHERKLWNFVRRFVPEPAAEDVLQEVFLRVVKGAAHWRPEAKVTTWLFTIARNLCTDHARRADVRRATSLDGAATGRSEDEGGERGGARLVDRVPGADRGGEAAVMDREAAQRLEAALVLLPVEQREVFLMREVMELPFAEIAAAVGTSEPTVKSRMRYALLRLREALGELRDATAAQVVHERVGQTP